MPEINFNRRSMMKLAGAGLVGSAVATGDAGAQGGSQRDQLNEVTSATEQYSDPQVALDDGFVVLGPYVPDMGWHLLHPGRVLDAVENGFEIDAPQLLTYDDAGGNLKLASIEYGIPVGARGYDEENPPVLFDDPEEHWHVHGHAEHVFAVPPPPPDPADVGLDDQLHTTRWVEIVPVGAVEDPMFEPGTTIVTDFAAGATLEPRVVLHSEVHPDLWTLHVWVHEKNPDGVFAETNRTLANSPRP